MLELRGAQYSYGDGEAGIGPIDLRVLPGERLAVIGRNGSGKSTLADLLCGSKTMNAGTLAIDGAQVVSRQVPARLRAIVGRVHQDPADQMVAVRVRDEVAFGPRNLGLPADDVRSRCREALDAVGLHGYGARLVEGLSGGERQRVALADVVAMRPRVLLLDEVTAMLDGPSRDEVHAAVDAVCARTGAACVTVTHRAEEVRRCDRVIVLESGHIIWEGAVGALAQDRPDFICDLLRGPMPADWADLQTVSGVTGHEGRGDREHSLVTGRPSEAGRDSARCRIVASGGSPGAGASGAGLDLDDGSGRPEALPSASEPIVLRDATFTYPPDPLSAANSRFGVHAVSLTVEAGGITVLAGRSGSGKSTTAGLAAGLYAPDSGIVTIGGSKVRLGSVGLALQRPEDQLFSDTVLQDIAYGARNAGVAPEDALERARGAARTVGLPEDTWERDPFSLSGGQARRAALAGLVAMGPAAYVLDEPTAGLDAPGVRLVRDLVVDLARTKPVLLVTHDLEEWLPVARRVAFMEGGRLVGTDDARAVWDRMAAGEPWGRTMARELHARTSGAGGPVDGNGAIASGPTEPVRKGPRVRGPFSAGGKLGLVAILAVAAFASPHPEVLAVEAILLVAACLWSRVSSRELVRPFAPMAVVLGVMFASNAFALDGSAAVRLWGPLGFDPAGAARASLSAARIALLLGFSAVLAATTDPDQISDAVARALRPLGRWGLPADDAAMTVSIALAFLPEAAREMRRLHQAQAARGAGLDRGGAVARVRSWGAVVVPLAVRMFRRADALGAAMEERRWGTGPRTDLGAGALTGADRAALGLAAAACALAIVV